MHDNTDTKAIKLEAAIELARYKMLKEIKRDNKYPTLTLNDVNEIMLVAGVPFVTENELDVVEINHEETEVEA